MESGENPELCRNCKVAYKERISQIHYLKPPEQEQTFFEYLSAHAGGDFLMQTYEKVEQQQPQINEYLKAYDDTATWLAEVLDGSMYTSFEFTFDGRELHGRDGRELGGVFNSAIVDAEQLTDKNPNLLFELKRRYIERQEYSDMLAMARGELPSTMVVVSDFPPELMDATKSIGGYDVARKQTMLRVISRQSDGTIVMETQSLDGSNRTALEALYSSLQATPQKGELLAQRMYANQTPEDQKTMINRLTSCYDQSLREQFGGDYYAGRKNKSRDTFAFVQAQTQLLDEFSQMVMQGRADEDAYYNLAAAITSRMYYQTQTYAAQSEAGILEASQLLQREMHVAGQLARSQGKSYSGCGMTLAAEESSESELQKSGYGNKSDGESYKFDKQMHCVVCQAPPKQGDGKKMCGPCGICRGCDAKLSKK